MSWQYSLNLNSNKFYWIKASNYRCGKTTSVADFMQKCSFQSSILMEKYIKGAWFVGKSVRW